MGFIVTGGVNFSGGSSLAQYVVPGDPYFNYTTLLLPGGGTNNGTNNTFIDGSTNNFTITRYGDATQGTFTPFSLVNWSNFFSGTSGEYLLAPANAAFSFGTGNFTIEGWLYPTGTNASAPMPIVEIRSSTSSTGGFAFMRAANSLTLNCYQGGYLGASTNSLIMNYWNHVALVRSSNTWSYYINGVFSGSFTNSSNLTDGATNTPRIGGSTTAGEVWFGNISNLRITKGAALYTSGFIPPTSPLTTTVSAGTVSLLTANSNRFVDTSSNAFAITANGSATGNPAVSTFNPFFPTTAWSASTNGGSGSFDGTGDYLTCPNAGALTLGSGNWTVETWVYITTTSPAYQGIIDWRPSATTGYPELGLKNNTFVWFMPVAGNLITSSSIDLNTWYHVAVCKSGSSTKMFLNGVQTGSTYTDTNNYLSTNPIRIANTYDNYELNGYLSDTRVVIGTALYTANFTPPTAPLTAIANTQLLLNYTNAQAIDSTTNNSFLTKGNAVVSTTQYKWSPSSIYLNGTANTFLIAPADSEAGELGTGDFTIEFWLNASAAGTYAAVVGTQSITGNTTAGMWKIFSRYNSTNALYFTYTTGSAFTNLSFGATNPNDGAWHFIAVTRSSGTLRMFFDGTQIGSNQTVTQSLSSGQKLNVGWDGNGNTMLTGYVQDVRITKGYARYIYNFTVPAAAFPAY